VANRAYQRHVILRSRRRPAGPMKDYGPAERIPTEQRPVAFPHAETSVNLLPSAVGVAQLVERRTVAPNVAGSNPVSHPNPDTN
jgi:hypothetical protein